MTIELIKDLEFAYESRLYSFPSGPLEIADTVGSHILSSFPDFVKGGNKRRDQNDDQSTPNE